MPAVLQKGKDGEPAVFMETGEETGGEIADGRTGEDIAGTRLVFAAT